MIAQIDLQARFELELVHKLGIQARAGGRKRLEDGGSFKAAVDQHAAGGVRGFTARLSALDYQDTCPAFSQCEGE